MLVKGRTEMTVSLRKVGLRLAIALALMAPVGMMAAATASHPDRNAQFEYINTRVRQYLGRRDPVISVDTKKKELVGRFKNGGREWRPRGQPEKVQVHDFVTEQGRAYGVYDLGANTGWVSVGITHDTAQFAVATIRRWWQGMGLRRYPKARRLLITADAGGSNGARLRLWKTELQKLADGLHLPIAVSHFPPGTSKWNKIEHKPRRDRQAHRRDQDHDGAHGPGAPRSPHVSEGNQDQPGRARPRPTAARHIPRRLELHDPPDPRSKMILLFRDGRLADDIRFP